MMSKNDCPRPSGIIVIVGGKEKKGKEEPANKEEGDVRSDILERFAGLTGKKYANILIVTSGSKEGETMFEEYRKAFNDLGHTAIGWIHHNIRQEVLEDDQLLQKVNDADAVFFAGGDQLLLTSLYGGSAFLTRLKERYIDEQLVVGGTSAGAMAMSTPMIYAGNQDVQEISGEIKVTTGLEFLKDVCVDTHFVHRGRFIRLAQVIATNPGCTGIGVEEDTAVIVRNGVDAEVIGTGTVNVLLGFSIVRSDMDNFMEKKPVSIRNLQVDILAPGDTFCIHQVNPPHK